MPLNLDDLYKRYFLGLRPLENPLNANAYVVPQDQLGRYNLQPRPNGDELGGMLRGSDNTLYINDKFKDNPSVVQHELIHAAQSRQKELPDSTIMQALSPLFDAGWKHPGIAKSMQYGSNDPIGREAPAYAFQELMNKLWQPYQQAAYNNYMLGSAKQDPQHVSSLEAVMPALLEKGFLRSVPRPIAMPLPGGLR